MRCGVRVRGAVMGRLPGHADFGSEPSWEWRCRDSGELGGCAECEDSYDGEDEGTGEVHGEGG